MFEKCIEKNIIYLCVLKQIIPWTSATTQDGVHEASASNVLNYVLNMNTSIQISSKI